MVLMIAALSRYLRLIKFSHSIFALPMAGIAVVQALPASPLLEGGAGLLLRALLLVLVAMVALRSAAMGFNRLVDRDFDRKNPRTANRELATGEISVASARLFVILSVTIFMVAAWLLNPLCGWLSPLAIGVVFFYSYTKRFTWLCHFFLGLAIGLAPTAAWIAILERVDLAPVLWSAGLLFYIAGFDLLYSCQDAEFDRKLGLSSLPARFGVPTALVVARLSHGAALVFFALAGFYSGTGLLFAVTLLVVAALFFLEHYLVRGGKLHHIPIAFFHVNAAISSVLFLGIVLDMVVAL